MAKSKAKPEPAAAPGGPTLEDVKAERDALKAERDEMRQELLRGSRELQDKDREVKDLQRHGGSVGGDLRNSNQDLLQKLGAAEAERDEYKAEVARLTQELNDSARAGVERSRKLEAMERQQDQLRAANRKLEDTHKSLKKEYDDKLTQLPEDLRKQLSESKPPKEF